MFKRPGDVEACLALNKYGALVILPDSGGTDAMKMTQFTFRALIAGPPIHVPRRGKWRTVPSLVLETAYIVPHQNGVPSSNGIFERHAILSDLLPI